MAKSKCQPPFSLTSDSVSLASGTAEKIDRLSAQADSGKDLRRRRVHRIRAITDSLATVRYRGPKNGGRWEVLQTDTGKQRK